MRRRGAKQAAARGISPHLVTQTLNEAGAVWNGAGITLAWRRKPSRFQRTTPGNPFALAVGDDD